MISRLCKILLPLAVLGATVQGVAAADMAYGDPLPGSAKILRSEFRGGVLYHDTMNRESGVDINAEIISRWGGFQFNAPWNTNVMLRPHIGGNLNLSGDTSMVYAGYTLTIDLTDRLFVEGTFGGMAHNGNTRVGVPGKLALGCNVMFRESASLGYWLTDTVNLSAMIEHSSNNGYCTSNNGLTNLGVRLGYAF